MSTQSQFLVTATIDGQPVGLWDTLSGGETTADISKRRAGGKPNETASRSRSTTGDVTISREFDRERDMALAKRLRTRVGRAPVVITEQPLDDDDVPFGKPTIYTGLLSGVNTGEYDSNSDDDRMMEITAVITAVS